MTPVLEGTCRIQGPVDESDHEFVQMKSGAIPSGNKYMVLDESFCPKEESGTCNVCSSPCASCLHFNVMESNIESNSTNFKLRREEADCCSFSCTSFLPEEENGDDLQHENSGTSNLGNVRCIPNSYSENAESKATLAVNGTNDTSEDVGRPENVLSGEAVREPILLPKEVNFSACLPSSKNRATADLHQALGERQNEGQHHLDCHGDNISDLTGGIFATSVNVLDVEVNSKETTIGFTSTRFSPSHGIEKTLQVEACHICLDFGIEKGETKPTGTGAWQKELHKNTCLSAATGTTTASISNQSGYLELVSLKMNSLKGEPLKHFKEDEPSSGSLRSCCSEGQKTAMDALANHQCQNKSSSSPEVLSSNYPSQESEMCNEIETRSNDSFEPAKCIAKNELFVKSSTLPGTSEIQGSEVQHRHATEGEISGSNIEDDVKVCDTCGDAGREECLAICTRCSDGAEHIYCMRTMMEKLPESNWLCEECKLKEHVETRKVDRTETLPRTSRSVSVIENIYSSILQPKNIPKLVTSESDPEMKGKIRELPSLVNSTKRDNSHMELCRKRSSESNGYTTGTASPRKRISFARGSSLKILDAGKAKPANSASACESQFMNASLSPVHSQTRSSFNHSKNQSQIQTPQGCLSNSYSFTNTGVKGKTRQLIENIPHEPKPSKGFATREAMKVGLVRAMTKSPSFHGVGSGLSSGQSVSKTQSLDSPQAADPRGCRQVKKSNSVNKENSFKLERDVNPLSIVSAGMSSSKVEFKSAQLHPKSKMSETNIRRGNRGMEDANDLGCSEVKKQPFSTPKPFGSPSHGCKLEVQIPSVLPSKGGLLSIVDKSSIQMDAVPCGLPHLAESSLQNHEAMGSNIFSSSRQLGVHSAQMPYCQRCNKTGHATQFCPIDKLRLSALKPSSDCNLKELRSKTNKWKDAVEAVVSKTKMQKNSRLTKDSELVVADMSCEASSKDMTFPSSVSMRKLPILGDTTGRHKMLRSPAFASKPVDSNVKQQSMLQLEAYVAGGQKSNITENLGKLIVKPVVQTIPDGSYSCGNSLRVAAIPEFQFIWQGDFEVLRTDRRLEPCHGVQAHLSTFASPKVPEVVMKFPDKINLEEVNCLSFWPLQFQRTSPKDDNIALFFFAKDVESYEKNYKKLLDNMLENDLSLKGIVDGVELLIFPSNKLPENSQRWNSLLFLWGVFRERNLDCLETQINLQKTYKSNYAVLDFVQDSQNPGLPTSQEIISNDIPEKCLTKTERPPEVDNECSNHFSVLPGLTSVNKDQPCQIGMSQLVQGSSQLRGQLHGLMNFQLDSGTQKNDSGDSAGERSAEPSNNAPNCLANCDVLPIFPIHWASKAGTEGICDEPSIGNETSGLVPCKENRNPLCGNNQQEHKKMKLCSQPHASSSSSAEDDGNDPRHVVSPLVSLRSSNV